MTKDTFTQALKRAQTLSGAYPIEESERDIFYEALQGELDEDIVYALDKIGKGGMKISYPNIEHFINEKKNERFKVKKVQAHKPFEYVPMPPETKEAIAQLHKKFDGKKGGKDA